MTKIKKFVKNQSRSSIVGTANSVVLWSLSVSWKIVWKHFEFHRFSVYASHLEVLSVPEEELRSQLLQHHRLEDSVDHNLH